MPNDGCTIAHYEQTGGWLGIVLMMCIVSPAQGCPPKHGTGGIGRPEGRYIVMILRGLGGTMARSFPLLPTRF